MIINKKTHLPSISSRGKRLRKNPFFGFFVLLILFVGSPLSVFGNTEDIDSKEMIIQLTLSGVITDDTGSPLPGASIAEKGTANGVISDFDGTFSIAVADSNAVIVITYLGFDSVEVNAADFSDNMTISLSESSSALDEIVITGYGRQVKRNITGAVSAISLKQIENLPLATFENAIQGQIAGVQVTEASGEPGAGATVRVRGVGSISAGNEPLYVIDGFPISKNVGIGVQGDNFRRRSSFRPPSQNPLANLNPNDIESIQVLKDASTASIYGSRGSNGVIIITTKRGKKGGAPSFSYNSFFGSQSVANKLDLMNSAELIDYNRDATNNAYLQRNPGASATDPNSVRTNAAWRLAEDVLSPSGVDVDWQDVVFRSAMVQTHNLSVSGGSDNSSYYISGNLFDQDGIIEKSNFKRYSLRVNLEVDLNERTRIGLNLAPSYVVSDKVPAGSPYFARPPGIVYSGIVHAPFIEPYNPDGSINQLNNQSYVLTPAGQTTSFTSASNPLAIIEAVDDQLNQNRTFGNIFAEYDLMDNLTFKSYFGVDINNYKRNFYRASSLLYRTATTGETFGQTASSESLSWVAEQTLNYSKEIGSHTIDALIGYTAQKEKIDISSAVADTFPDDLVKTISGGQIASGSAVQEEWSLVSLLAKVNYSYEDRFLATASLRSDTSSRFGRGNKTGVFSSFSGGYRMSEDINADWLSDLKLRASWGETGNFLIPNYASIGLLSSYNTTFDGALTNGIAPSTISNQDLSWEKTTSFDIGLDFGFLNDRIYGSLEYFKSTTTDLLLAVQIPSALGFTNALTNIGEVVNKGFEISVTSRNLTGVLNWTTDFNFSTIDNEVTKLGPSGDPILSRGGAGNRHITKIGEPIGSYYGYQTDGIYQNQAEIDNSGIVDQIATPQPGDFKWVDVNNDGFINSADRTTIGNYLPDFTYGITNRFEYNNFEFSFLLQGVEGNEVLNLTRRHMGNGEANYNSYSEWNNRWRSEAEPGNGLIPRANRQTGNSNNRPSNYQVEDASYLRLRNVTLAYTFPENSLNGKLDRLRLYLSGTNLFTKTDYLGFNPEVNNQDDNTNVQGEDYGAYPLSSVITFGINAKF
ncbi:MAG: TonB-dependent receptor [Flavobacteriales bacterium]|jgi:TonB-linked SusC/RagA family outer membrane protein|nr:TonB-dependent receptor [Flavobacteriales bacterium]